MAGSEGWLPPAQPSPCVLPALRADLDTCTLYVHIPFCAAKCAYCDFSSFAGVPGTLVERILDETLRQLQHFAARLRPKAVPSVYVGGGTPSLLCPEQVAGLLRGARAFGAGSGSSEPPETTVEANPESLGEEWLAACREAGANRISLGVQSLHDPLLQALGRRATAAQARRGLSLLQRGWPLSTNVDLLAGIPGQTTRELERDIREVEACGHVSLYTLTPPSGSSVRLDRDRADRLWLSGKRLLERLGFENYEVSNFARPGRQCRHNLGYWRLDPYLGVGPAAVATLPSPEGAPQRLSNPAFLERFLAGQGWGIQVEQIAPREFLLETLMVGLRLREGIRAEVFTRRFGQGLPQLLPVLWREWRGRGVVREGKEAYALTEEARLRLNPLLVEASSAIEREAPALALRWP